MSKPRIDRSPDLRRLRDEGYDIEVRERHLLVKSVPYLNAKGEVHRGTLVMEFSCAGDVVSIGSNRRCLGKSAELFRQFHLVNLRSAKIHWFPRNTNLPPAKMTAIALNQTPPNAGRRREICHLLLVVNQPRLTDLPHHVLCGVNTAVSNRWNHTSSATLRVWP